MALTLELAKLGSRAVRKGIGSNGVRRFATSALSEKADDEGNIIERLWNGFTRFGGSLVSKVISALTTVISFSFTLLWSLTVSAVTFIWNFNWNTTDAELDASVQAGITAVAGTLGGTLGNALGFLACGAVPGALIFAFNEPLGLHVLEEVGEEALDELAGNVANLVRQVGNLALRATLGYLYKNIRKLWRQPDSAVRARLIADGVTSSEKIDKALAERNKPWSFASAFESAVDSIPNEALRNFTEEFFEELGDSCVEAGYVVANSVDTYLAAQQLAARNILGEEKTVEILLNRNGVATVE